MKCCSANSMTEGCSIRRGEKQPGRSASRNWLASQAQFPYLVFLDGDSALPDDHYVDRYFGLLPPNWFGWVEPPTAGKRRRRQTAAMGLW